MLGLGLGLQKSTKLGGFIGLLDLVPNAAAAYSLRLLRKNYSGGLVRVRAWDGLANQGEADVMAYHVSSTEYVLDLNSTLEDLDATAIGRGLTTSDTLADLVSTGVNDYDGLTSSWYDQSLSNDATQSAGASQPKIVSGGSLVTENGKPAVDFDGVDDVLVKSNPTGMPTGQQARSFFVALKSYLPSSSARDYLSIGDGGTSSDLKKWRLVAEWSVRIFGDSVIYNTILQNTHYLSTNIYNGGTISSNNFYENGVLQSGTGGTSIPNTSAGNLYIGKYPSIINGFDGAIQELIIYSSDQSSNRAAIETNINTFYSIYL